jgi:glycosyltransferase involved in cell wall biosynthesis
VTRLAVFSTHPIQYFSPLWRELAGRRGLDMTVHYFSDHSVSGGLDPAFGVPVAWDVPLLEGYRHTFVSRRADLARPWTIGLSDAEALLRAGRFDAVLLQGYTRAFERQVLRAARRLGLAVIMRGEFSTMAPSRGVKRLARGLYLRWFYRQVDAFGAIGSDASRHLLAHGVAADQIFSSPYAVDSVAFEKMRRGADRGAARRRLGYRSGERVVLFSGKLIERKQPLQLLQALAKVSGLRALFVGDGPLGPACRSWAEAQLPGRVHFAGFVNQSALGPYFAAADLLALPSLQETWGLVVNEAMHFGLPVLVSDQVGSQVDLVVPGQTGLVFPAGDVSSLGEALATMTKDAAILRRMGRQARRQVAGHTVQAAADGLVLALEHSLRGRRPA